MDGLATLKAENRIQFKTLDDGKTEVSFVVDKLSMQNRNSIKAALEEAGDTRQEFIQLIGKNYL